MNAPSSLLKISALAMIITAAAAQAGTSTSSLRAADDEVKPPVFAFAPLTETRALTVVDPASPVWTDDYRPAPPSFYESR